VTDADDRFAVIATLDRYATALDRRSWPLLDDVFTPDVAAEWAGARWSGRDELVAMIRSHLDGCGPTQHLLGNYDVAVEGDRADATCRVRAFHVGRGDRSHLTYEMLGFYRAVLVRTGDGWRVAEWHGETTHELGTRDVLGGA
jgi:hypothetical protein